jgi:hypothetical protein
MTYDIQDLRMLHPKAPTPGETMEKSKPAPAWISGQVRSGQVILYFVEKYYTAYHYERSLQIRPDG